MTLPSYVQRGGELVYQVPYAARNATQFIFLLRADAARLAATFARDFGTPSGGAVEVRPAMGLVILAASRIPAIVHQRLLRLLQSFIEWVRDRAARSVDVDDRVYRIGQLVEIVVASIRGIVSDGVLTKGFAAIDDREFLDWLRSHGASDDAVKSPVLIGGYDLAFAFRGGDPARPSMAARVALENAARLFFTYKGAMFWKMQAGMGDVVFAPLYQVLRRRGVSFRFFTG